MRGARSNSRPPIREQPMDGDQLANRTVTQALAPEPAARERGDSRGSTARHGPKTVRWLVIVALLLVVVLGGLYGFNRFRTQAISQFFCAQQAAAGADQRRRGREPIGPALCPRHRLAHRSSSGHDQPRGRRAGHQDLFRAGADGESRRPAGANQRRAGSRRSRQLRGAGSDSRKSQLARSRPIGQTSIHVAGDRRPEPKPARRRRMRRS